MECVFWDLAAGTKGDKLVTLLILWGDIADQSLGQNNAENSHEIRRNVSFKFVFCATAGLGDNVA